MKLVIIYLVGLTFAWLGVHSVLVAIAYWESSGALLPLVVGILLVLFSMRLLTVAVRLYFKPPTRG